MLDKKHEKNSLIEIIFDMPVTDYEDSDAK
jgi:hypothetical protein